AALTAMGFEGTKLENYKAHVGATDLVGMFGQAATDRAFRAPLANLLEDRMSTGAPTYAYQFAWRSQAFGGAVGAVHCIDLPFAFDNLDADHTTDGFVGPGAPQRLADEMHRDWVRLIAT